MRECQDVAFFRSQRVEQEMRLIAKICLHPAFVTSGINLTTLQHHNLQQQYKSWVLCLPGAAGLVSSGWSTLRALDLSSCGMSSVGIQALAAGEGVRHLSSLVLRSNSLGAEAGPSLAALLTAACKLTSLDVSHNELKVCAKAAICVDC